MGLGIRGRESGCGRAFFFSPPSGLLRDVPLMRPLPPCLALPLELTGAKWGQLSPPIMPKSPSLFFLLLSWLCFGARQRADTGTHRAIVPNPISPLRIPIGAATRRNDQSSSFRVRARRQGYVTSKKTSLVQSAYTYYATIPLVHDAHQDMCLRCIIVPMSQIISTPRIRSSLAATPFCFYCPSMASVV